MEIAIPFIALAGAYIISNQPPNNSERSQRRRLEKGLKRIETDKPSTESFTNMGYKATLPNTNIPPQNYPVSNLNELTDTVQKYQNPNTATDKYFNQNAYENKQNAGGNVGSTIKDVYSLTGDYLDTKEFKHNNMVPFYGGKIKGQVYDINITENILDNMIGSGSQVIKKIEQAPLFKPQDNIQWASGAPNMSDFYQSRVNPGMKNSNVKPFDSQNVGPGLNQGYGTSGSGGFNSGMESRDSWLPKTVDELRVETNPKMEYTLENHQGPSYSHVQNVGILGKVEKYHPDTFFINTQDRWLTTTGQEKGQALRPIEEDRYTTRSNTTQSYSGVASATEKNGSYAPTNFTPTKRVELETQNVAICAAQGRGPHGDSDHLIQSFTNYTNNRATMKQPDSFRSSFSGAIGAVIAPIMDAFRPTRKEEYGDNIRVYGDAGSNVASNYVLNTGDVPAVTVKETTLYAPDSYIGNQASVGYVLHNQQAIANQRDTTLSSYTGSVGGNGASRQGEVLVDSAYRQTNNNKLEAMQGSYTPQGGTQIYNQTMNVNVSRIDSDRVNPRMWVPQATSISQMPASKETYGKTISRQVYDENKIGCDRISGDLLSAFKSNPYTHSLTDCV